MKDKQLEVKVFNHLQSDLQDQDIRTWKNIDRGHQKVVHPGGEPAEFLFQPDELLKEVNVTADPVKKGGQRAPLHITISSNKNVDITFQLRKEIAIDKWVMGFGNIIPGSDDDFAEDPPVVNVTVGEDEPPDVLVLEKPGRS